MKPKHLTILILSMLLISACASHEKYPSQWDKFQQPASTGCLNISGKYKNAGMSTTPGYEPELAWMLFPDEHDLNRQVTHISFAMKGPDTITVTLWEKGDAIFSKGFQRGEQGFYCEDKLIKIKVSENINRDGVLATEWHVLGFGKSGRNLIVKDENRAIGMMFFIPVAGTATRWYRFEPSK